MIKQVWSYIKIFAAIIGTFLLMLAGAAFVLFILWNSVAAPILTLLGFDVGYGPSGCSARAGCDPMDYAE